MRKILSSLILLSLSLTSALADDYSYGSEMRCDYPRFENLGEQMKDPYCRAMIEDSEGYLWISTRNGICRYDGISFKYFFHDDKIQDAGFSAQSLLDDTISNCIWAVDYRGRVYKIDKRTYSCEEFRLPKAANGKQLFYLSLEAYNDTLFLATAPKSLQLVDKRTFSVVAESNFDSKDYLIPNIFVKTKNGTYFSRRNLFSLNHVGADSISFDEVVMDANIGKISFKHIVPSNESSVLFDAIISKAGNGSDKSSHAVIGMLNSQDNTYKFLFELPRGVVNGIADSQNYIWVAINGGVFLYDKVTGEIRDFYTGNSELNDNAVSCVVKSKRQPIVWLGTSDGLIKCDYFYSRFNRIDIRRHIDYYRHNILQLFMDKKSRLWMTSFDRLFYKDSDKGYFKSFNIHCSNKKQPVMCMIEDDERDVLYTSIIDQMIEIDMTTGRQSIVCTADSGRIRDIVKVDDKMYFLSSRGFLVYDFKTHVRKEIKTKRSNLKLVHLVYDGDSIMWLGSDNGNIYKYNTLTNTFDDQGIIVDEDSKTIKKLVPSKKNGVSELWILSNNKVYYYLPEKQHITRLGYFDDLEMPSVMEKDRLGNIWVGGRKCLMCIDNQNGRVYKYGRDYIGNFNIMYSSVGKGGKIVMGGGSSIIEFNTLETARNEYFPTPVLASYKLVNSTATAYDGFVMSDMMTNSDTIFIPAGVRSFQLEARVLNFSESKHNKIQWRLPKINTTWTTTFTTEPITLTDIPRGVLQLELRSLDADGQPTDNVRTLYLNHEVYFFERIEFRALIVALFILAIAGLIAYRSKREENRRKILQQEVERQAGELIIANKELKENQKMIEEQNAELIIHRNNLEQQVKDRTAELDIAREKAEESSRLKSSFLATLSHEVRTPMNCIVGFSKLLADPSCTPSEQKEFVHLIQESSQGMLVLIGDLLDVSRIESKQLRINRVDFEVEREISDVFKMLQVERKNANVDFELMADVELTGKIINSDKDRFRQMIINLCYNAFKFTEHGFVKLHADIVAGNQLPVYSYPSTLPIPDVKQLLLIRVEDTGIGMPQEKLEEIFEPFRKLNNNKTLYPGLGLGLSIVKNLVNILDGQIWVTSEEGRGTTFSFFLPF